MDTLRRTNMHFVHCLLPQTTAGLSDLRGSSPGKTDTDDYMLNVPFVRLQVRGAELLDAVRLHRHGISFKIFNIGVSAILGQEG